MALIVTLKLNAAAFEILDELRRRHFPAERNFLPAHVTLFHALPDEIETFTRRTLDDVCARTGVLSLSLPRPRFLGRGVALEVESPELIAVRRDLARSFAPHLSAQDRQGYRPHVTIQNKVPPETARGLYDELTVTWEALEAQGEALLLWRYLGGPWGFVGEHPFNSNRP